MKKTLLILSICASTLGFAQKNKFGIQFNAGAHLLGEAGNGLSLNTALTYNFVPSFGLKLDGGLDIIGENNLNRLGLQLNLNVVKIANKEAKFGLEVHGGAALLNNGNYIFNDTYLFRGDDMVAIMAGITPSFQVSEHLRILVDATYMPKLFKIDGVITKYLNTTVGVAYNF